MTDEIIKARIEDEIKNLKRKLALAKNLLAAYNDQDNKRKKIVTQSKPDLTKT